MILVHDAALDEMIEPVCKLAAMKPMNDWPDDIKRLVAEARKVQRAYGFEVETIPAPMSSRR